MVHAVKCWPKYFSPLYSGEKNFEVRRNDRPYRVGDILAVNEFIPESADPYDDFLEPPPSSEEHLTDDGKYTGRYLLFKITYILADKEFCKDGTIVMGLMYLGGKTDEIQSNYISIQG